MDYAMISVPAAPVRRKPGHSREMVSQLLFGESVRILKAKSSLWVRVQSLHDGYEGWMTKTQLEETDQASAGTPMLFVTTDLMSSLRAGNNIMHIPAGSSLPFFVAGNGNPAEQVAGRCKLGKIEYELTGNYCKRDEQQPGAGLLQQLTLPWLNAPYLWGGRTPMGVDCSGFVQVIFKLMGIDLPRDTWQQAQKGKAVDKFKDARPGDLAFFNNKEDIVHVGIIMEDETIIHASGRVRTDTLTKKGVLRADAGKRILRLQAIRRFW